MPKLDKIVVHWGAHTRSTRVIWLLNVLELPYEIKEYHDKEFPPPALHDVDGIGRYPVVEIKYKDGITRVLSESGYIFDFILRHFDSDRHISGKTEEDKEDVRFFLYFSEGSVVVSEMPAVVNEVMKTPHIDHPYFDSYLPRYRHTTFQFIDNWCKNRQDNGKFYLVGDDITAADIIMLYPCQLYSGTVFPHMAKWVKGMQQCPDYQDAQKLGSSK